MVQQTGSNGAWSMDSVAGHPCAFYEPPQPSPHGYTVLYLHAVGRENLADDPVFTAEFARHGLRAVAPQGDESWWCDRVWPAFDAKLPAETWLVEHVLPAIAERWNVVPPRIGVMGISMGGQGALRLAYKYPDKFPVAAAISPAIDFHEWIDRPKYQPEIATALRAMYRDSEDARQDTVTILIHPLNWPRHQFFCSDPADHWHTSADRLQMKLASIGIPHECDLETRAGGHSWDYFHTMAPRAVEFVAQRLERERLRLV